MGWTETTRRRYCRAGQRDANVLTDKEWELIEPFLPGTKATGRPRTTELRAVVDALLYIAWTGCQWRDLPDRFPPVSMVQRYFYAWRDNGLWKAINFHLVAAARLALGREASPSAGVIDSQSAKTADVAGLRGYDAGKKPQAPYHYRHRGHLVGLTVHTADIQDRDGAVGVIASIRRLYPWLRSYCGIVDSRISLVWWEASATQRGSAGD